MKMGLIFLTACFVNVIYICSASLWSRETNRAVTSVYKAHAAILAEFNFKKTKQDIFVFTMVFTLCLQVILLQKCNFTLNVEE